MVMWRTQTVIVMLLVMTEKVEFVMLLVMIEKVGFVMILEKLPAASLKTLPTLNKHQMSVNKAIRKSK